MNVRRGVLAVAALAVFCSVLCVGQFASAAAIVGSMQDSFSDYGAVTFNNITPPSTSQNGGLGWNAAGAGATTADNSTAASWGAQSNAGVLRTVNAPGLTYSATGYLAASGNKLTLDASSTNVTQNIGRPLGGQAINDGTTFFSLLISRNTADTFRTINMAFLDGTTERMAVGQIGAANGNSAGNIVLFMNNTNPGGIIPAGGIPATGSPIAMGNSLTHLLVGRIDWTTGFETVSLWVDPTDVTTQAAAGPAYASTSAFELTQITAIRPFVGNTAGGFNGVSANFDEIRLGGTWESVTSQPVAVPEPATLLLAGLGAIGLAVSARRRKAA